MQLFDLSHPDCPPLAQTEHPQTSHLAAQEILAKLPRLIALAAECVKRTPGKTRSELNEIHCHGKDIIGKRLDGARKLGLVRNGADRQCSITGRMAQTWE